MTELKFYKGNLLSIKGQLLQRSAFNGAVKCEPYCLNKERGVYIPVSGVCWQLTVH